MKKIFEFKKQRSIDEIIEGSFQFFRTHIKKILQILWQYNAILIIGLMSSYFLYNYFYFGSFNSLFTKSGQEDLVLQNYGAKFLVVAFALFVFSFFFFPRFFATVLGYIRVYMENDGHVLPEKVQVYVKGKFWGLIGITFLLVGMIAMAGLFFFILLGISKSIGSILMLLFIFPAFFYLTVYATLLFYVYFFEDTNITETFVKTKNYIKHRFWFSFWTIFILGLIVGILGAIFNAPIMIYAFIKGIMMTKETGMTQYAQQGDLFISAISVLSYIGQLVLKVLNIIGIALLYFSVREYHTHESVLEQIDQIGKETTSYDN